jgi:MoxR-like ATPase
VELFIKNIIENLPIMLSEKIRIKPYPQPNPQVKNSSSRFAVAHVKGVDTLAAADPAYPVCEFRYEPHTVSGSFQQLKDGNGQPLTKKGRPLDPYLPSAELVELVRLAQVLQRPVLIKGEPGSGKTQLARSVAFEWYGDAYKNHFFEWTIKSTSRAVDGLYTFDHVARLRNAQLKRTGADEAPEDLTQYRSFGPMAKSFLTSSPENPSILLIDEIDKADIDFANDLLLELDERRFTIPEAETGELIEARYPPLIFITSNDERELPEAFLRRCIFLYIKFPDDQQLVKIIKAHIPGLVEENPAFVDAAINRFNRLRDEIKEDPTDNKRVSTSELLDWLTAYQFSIRAGDTKIVEQDLKDLPFYHHALLKTYASVNRREQEKSKNS